MYTFNEILLNPVLVVVDLSLELPVLVLQKEDVFQCVVFLYFLVYLLSGL